FKSLVTLDPSGALASWNSTLHFCQWRGVTCGGHRRAQRVVGLDLARLGLIGTLSPSPSNLTFLRRLHLPNNQLGGPIPPELGRLHRLHHLNLDSNFLVREIQANLSRCANLMLLSIDFNMILGDLPSDLGSLPQLKRLTLDSNMLTGRIPPSIGNLSSLLELSLGHNRLEGSIPEEVGALTGLPSLNLESNMLSAFKGDPILRRKPNTSLLLNANDLEGGIPNSFGNYRLLQVLHLSETSSLKNLQLLDISDNFLSGDIPKSLGDCESLEYLHINRNFFQGSLHLTLSKLRALQVMNASHNHLSGPIPKFVESLQFLKVIDLSFNDLEGEVPKEGIFPNLTVNSVAGNPKLSVEVLRSKRDFPPSAPLSHVDQHSRISHWELVKMTNEFSRENFLGEGSFGSVYKGVLDEGRTLVAVKVLHLQRHGASKSFLAECEALRHVRHRNIVRIITSCSSLDSQGDFGLSRYILGNGKKWSKSFTSSIGIKGSIGYIAPEYGFGVKPHHPGDVYSYGILLLEMFTGKRPTDELFKEGLNLRRYVQMSFPSQIMIIVDPRLLQDEHDGANGNLQQSDIMKHDFRECLVSLVKRLGSCAPRIHRNRGSR
ncbi:hypothetical protein Taro_049369, partial [Colocasia esculenta]|nr:hypothetical protein [Colocasia esculenta]